MTNGRLLLAIGTERPVPEILMHWLTDISHRKGHELQQTMLSAYSPAVGQDMAILVAPSSVSSMRDSITALASNVPTIIIGRPEDRPFYPKACIWIDETNLNAKRICTAVEHLTVYATNFFKPLLDTSRFFAELRNRLEITSPLFFQLISCRNLQFHEDTGSRLQADTTKLFEKKFRAAAPKGALIGKLGGFQYALLSEAGYHLTANATDFTDKLDLECHISDPCPIEDYHKLGYCLQNCTSNIEQQRLVSQNTEPAQPTWKDSLATQDLIRALRHQEFFLEFQPQFDAKTGLIVGAEALLRWQHPSLGLIPPDKFIQDAEMSGLIKGIGDWVLRESLLAWNVLNQQGVTIRMSVNVAFPEIAAKDYADKLLKLLDEYEVPASCLELELTENTVMLDAHICRQNLRRLKRNGVRIALDDFGTGFSSLSHLNELPITAIKIDRGFVTPLGTKSHDLSQHHIVSTLIDLSHRLGLETVAEGVEDQQCLNIVQKLGCERIQGYIYAKPMSLDQLFDMAIEEKNQVYDLSGQRSLF